MKYNNNYFSSLLHRADKKKLHPFYDFRIWYISKYLKPNSLLDVGCGTAFIVDKLRKKGITAYGIDISIWALKNSPKHLKKYLSIGNITKIPYNDSAFDTISCIDVLEHINKNEIDIAIKECFRVAKNNIYFEITTLEDILFINTDITHVTKLFSWQWKKIIKNNLPEGWKLKRSFIFPLLHHGMFIAYKANYL